MLESLIYQFAKLSLCYIPNRKLRVKIRTKFDIILNKFFGTEKGAYIVKFTDIATQNSLNNHDYKIYSLGTNCYARIVSTVWGLKPRKKEGELSLPFDLSLHSLPIIVKILNNGFADYFDDLSYNGKCWINEKYNIRFVHDLENDKDKFIDRFRKRIANFYQALSDPLPTMFLCTLTVADDAGAIGDLYDYLKKMRGERPFRLFIINYSGQEIKVPELVILYNRELQTPLEKDFMKEHLQFCREGFEFEYPLVLKLKEELNRLIKGSS